MPDRYRPESALQTRVISLIDLIYSSPQFLISQQSGILLWSYSAFLPQSMRRLVITREMSHLVAIVTEYGTMSFSA